LARKRGAPLEIPPNNFDAMRLALASLVILSHCWLLIQAKIDNEPLGRWSKGVFNIGEFSVYAFFVISGFLVSASLKRSASVRPFLFKRVLRIYPAYFVAMATGYFIVAPLAGLSFRWLLQPKMIAQLVVGALLLRPLDVNHSFPNNPWPGSINGPLWTIAYEFACYLLLPIVGLLGFFRKRRRGILFLLLAVDIAADFIHHNDPFTDGVAPLYLSPDRFCRYSTYFIVGIIFFAYRDVVRYKSSLAAISAAALTFAAKSFLYFIFVGPISLAYLVFWFAFTPRIRLHHFGKHGDFSYGVYANGFPIQQLLIQWIGAVRLTPLGLFAIAWPLALLAGVISWFVVERPFLALKAKKIQSLPEPDLQKAVVS
jgi:peptidoglycan/LPS O-acetylase OafA/YrhL